jgi:hypothetical protein
MTTPDNIEEIKSILTASYPEFEFRSYHNTIIAKVLLNEASDYIQLDLTNQPAKDIISIYEEAWRNKQKWICYNSSYSDAYGFGSRFGGENPIEVFGEAVNNLHYRLNSLIEKARLSEVFLQKTRKERSNANTI